MDLVGFFLPCVLAESRGEVGSPRQPRFAGAEAGLQLSHLRREPRLQVNINAFGDGGNLLLDLRHAIACVFDLGVSLIRKLQHLNRSHRGSLCRGQRLLPDRGHLLVERLYRLLDLTDLLLQLGLELRKPFLLRLPGSLPVGVYDPLPGNPNGDLEPLEEVLLDALLSVFNQDIPHRIHGWLGQREIKLPLGVLEDLLLAEHAVLVDVVLVEDLHGLLHLEARLSLLDPLGLCLLGRCKDGLVAARVLVDPLQELCHGLLGVPRRLARSVLDPHLGAVLQHKLSAGLQLLLRLLACLVHSLPRGRDLLQLEVLLGGEGLRLLLERL
mmetsp:Transcript_34177/g.106400  ORF Transcript_34177/g.106400 Transcript_34177/m.106400 type:complete len:326 (+) Transcript_34177:1278-2255(+)